MDAGKVTPVLEWKDVSLSFFSGEGEVQAVRHVNLSLNKGEILALVGESGCGKSVLCKSVLRLLPPHAQVKTGQILLNGQDLTALPEKTLRTYRGKRIAMVFQDPLTSLNPTIPVGRQIQQAVMLHRKCSRPAARERALELMRLVELPELRYGQPPYALSGGQRQRCALAAALAGEPEVLLADEPTTALDVTVQAKILDLLLSLRKRMGLSIVFVSHDLGVVARIADRAAVMYAGKVVEIGTAAEVFSDPRHPYTWGLLASLPSRARRGRPLQTLPGMPPNLLHLPVGDPFAPRNAYALEIDYQQEPPMFPITPTHSAATWLLDPRAPKVMPPQQEPEVSEPASGRFAPSETVLEVRHLRQDFSIDRHHTIHAVRDVSFSIGKGERFGLVGESGCGKSTLARSILGLYRRTGGQIFFKGMELSQKDAFRREHRPLGREIQMVFQDSAAALNPRMSVLELIAEPLRVCGLNASQRTQRVRELMERVGLDAALLERRPGQLSGGQRQRVAIARALAPRPSLIVADEPIASLDLSIQAQIINLFQKLCQEEEIALLFIAHDLSVVQYLCDEVGVMLKGRLVERGTTEDVFSNPLHPYTRALLSVIPVPDPQQSQTVQVYDPAQLPEDGVLTEVLPGHWVEQS